MQINCPKFWNYENKWYIWVMKKTKLNIMDARESITIKKTKKGVWMKKYDDYEKSFRRISKKEAIESISNARERGDMFSDGNENSKYYELFGYWN